MISNFSKKIFLATLISSLFCISANIVSAATTPTLALTNSNSSVKMVVTGADPNATVVFGYQNNTTIDIGQTDSNGSFSVMLGQNSYGQNYGSQVYVSVDGASSSKVSWPASTMTSNQSGNSLSLSQTNVSLTLGQNVTIFASNATNALVINGNTNPSVTSVSIKDNTFFINALSVGSSTITACTSSEGCGSVNISVQPATNAVTFSQSPIYVTVGQSVTVTAYGPDSFYGLANSDQNVVTATLNGSSIVIKGLTVGRVALSLCATGWQCGVVNVNSLSSGSPIPNVTTVSAPVYSDQPLQLSSFSVSSNNVYGLFLGAGSTLNISFATNQSVTSMQVLIAGKKVAVNQGDNNTFHASLTLTGNEATPIPISLTFSNSTGKTGQGFFTIGGSNVTTAVGNVAQVTEQPVIETAGSFSFSKYLYAGMTSFGSVDAEVTALQQRLKNDGFFKGSITGYFGPQTKTALEAYQKKNGLSALGVVGPSTRALLNKGI